LVYDVHDSHVFETLPVHAVLRLVVFLAVNWWPFLLLFLDWLLLYEGDRAGGLFVFFVAMEQLST
jgi:hypothetical protein